MKQIHSIALMILLVVPAIAESDDKVDYVSQIKPLLEHKCYSCHGVLKQEAGLRLETLALMKSGGDSGSVIAADGAGSLLVERVTAEEDSRMPPAEDGAALQPEEIRLLRKWIDEGAHAPDEEIPGGPRDHWAFQPIQQPALPSHRSGGNPIDAFLQAKHQELGLKAQPRAQSSLLIRRLYLDLIGLPPTITQLHDQRSWRVIVDELLASPQHGERWGRHWMDVWRYSDWYGLGAQLRYSQKHLWHWRDWIINSLNDDKGYDRMIHEMLAGDEIAPLDQEAVTATGFLARNYYLFNRTTWLDSTIEHTGKAFLGLTLNCAKCHDHKYDPITHEDYYSFRAIFEPHQVRLDPLPGTTDFEKDGLPRAFDDHVEATTWLHLKGDPQNPDKETQITARVPALLSEFQPKITAVKLPPAAYAPGVREYVQQDQLQAAKTKVAAATSELDVARVKLAETQKALTAQKQSAAQQRDSSSAASNFKFVDNFDAPNPDVWEIVGADWSYQQGMLHRTSSTRSREFLRLRKAVPKDFEVFCRYTTTGGATYKSVTFRFDESADGRYSNNVYTSAHAPGPKVQVAYVRNGANSYPSEGRKAFPINVGEVIDLRLAVKDRLVNIWLNGNFQIAYQLPDRQAGGDFVLQAFDSTVAYDRIEVRSLADDVKLVEAKNSTTTSPQAAESLVSLASAKLAASEASLNSLQATIAAENAKHLKDGSFKTLAALAANAQAMALKADAAHDLLVAGEDANKIKAAKTKTNKANSQLAAIKQGDSSYEPLKASLKALEGPADKQVDYPAVYSETSTGRRTALAKWMTSRQNPLTARVAVNHVWMRHFGEPLVESVFDFGLRAKKPLHSDILDYLAADFMQNNWSFKRLHRLIVTSDTYQLSVSARDADPETVAADVDNKYYWRMNTRRMESQVVRDSLLFLAGTLDTTLGGPSLDIGNGSSRRSLYYKHSRDSQDKFLSMFDDADLLQCYRRSESIVPQQALALANSEVSMQNAEKIAARIFDSLDDSDRSQFVSAAIETLLGRPPVDLEEEYCLQFCKDLEALLQQDKTLNQTDFEMRIRPRLIHALINHNDFVSIR